MEGLHRMFAWQRLACRAPTAVRCGVLRGADAVTFGIIYTRDDGRFGRSHVACLRASSALAGLRTRADEPDFTRAAVQRSVSPRPPAAFLCRRLPQALDRQVSCAAGSTVLARWRRRPVVRATTKGWQYIVRPPCGPLGRAAFGPGIKRGGRRIFLFGYRCSVRRFPTCPPTRLPDCTTA